MNPDLKPFRTIVVCLFALSLLCAWPPPAQAQKKDDRDAALDALSVPQDKHLRKYDLDDARLAPEAIASARKFAVAAAATGDYRIDSLLSGYQWSVGTITYSFYEDSVFGGAYYGSESGVREVSEPVKANVRQIMAWYGTLVNRTFVEVTETTNSIGMIRLMLSNNPSYAYAYYPTNASMTSVAGDVHLNPSYDRLGDTNGFQHPPGKHGYLTLVHEIGHAIGLKHPFDGSPKLPAAEDNETHTVMTYTFTGYSAGTPMGYDLMALHYMYGARPNRPSNDSYLLTSVGPDQYNLGSTLYWNTPYHTRQTIWDSAGFNHLDCSGLPYNSSGYLLDLRPLGYLVPNNVNRGNDFDFGMVVGNGVGFYDVLNSSSSDTIYASALPNVFKGYSKTRVTGTDVIYGAASDDTLDLSGYLPSEVTQTRSGDDHVIGLGANGGVTLKGYYAGSMPAITFSPAAPSFSISDTSVTEGNSGVVLAVFTVSLSSASNQDLSVNYATADGTATTANNDYVSASGTLSFLAGETSKTATVQVIGDTAAESNEVFYVNLSGAASISDAQGAGTIVNDDVAKLAITSMSPTSDSFARNATVPITAQVMLGSSPAAGATVVFSMLKPDTKKATKKTVVTNSSGAAVWSYTIGRRDPLGDYTITAEATFNSQTASSSTPASFTVTQ